MKKSKSPVCSLNEKLEERNALSENSQNNIMKHEKKKNKTKQKKTNKQKKNNSGLKYENFNKSI